MNLFLALGAAALLQQPASFQGATSPANGDTTGYWQQHVNYKIVATLSEEEGKLKATGRLVYRNNSPDTLHEMFFHQYLNAFRPGSKWSARDAKENRVRFQNLGENDIGYERLTQAPVYNGTPVIVDYPGAPDSTVMHFRLPQMLLPGDSAVITFNWDARPSTVTRRQGRKGRTYDFAQWYPKVAVYDRGKWEPNPLVPAGELYGEFGEYDVTMIVRDDQVLASTGVPVNGDPGWARVSRTGAPYLAKNAYGDQPQTSVSVPAGYRAVRFLAKDVHHFAWSASPDYLYEGGTYVRRNPRMRFPTWDTLAVHVLYKPADDTSWGGGKALERTIVAAKWLESVWGPYAYPQITNIHRLDPGGTEFPMMIMDGSASQGLILHEFGHVFTYGILADNEWRSGWLDEGLTDYQTDWAQKLSPQDRDRGEIPLIETGYRANGSTIPKKDSAYLADLHLELIGRSQPIGTPAYAFSEFGIYNEMIYDRAKLMYGQLRDLMGDSTFLRFTHDYYSRWALKHVDERAIRASAEAAYGKSLGWFFDQWVHRTGLMDYRLRNWTIRTDGARYETIVSIQRRGELRHSMPVGVFTSKGWTIGRSDATQDIAEVRITTDEKPMGVQVDPYHTTFDWDQRNNVPPLEFLAFLPEPKFEFNWPYMNQADRSHTVVALSPAAWFSDPQGATIGIRTRTNYLSKVDLWDAGFAVASRLPTNALGDQPNFMTRVSLWARAENLYLPWMTRPAMGLGGGVNWMDGIFKADLYRDFDLSPFILTPGPKIALRTYATAASATDPQLLPEQWSKGTLGEIGGVMSYRTPILADTQYVVARASLAVGALAGADTGSDPVYGRAEGSLGIVQSLSSPWSQLRLRAYGAVTPSAPFHRRAFASSADPFQTFTNDLFRPRGALFKQTNANYLPLGGAGMRGYAIDVAFDRIGALNGELLQRVTTAKGPWGNATFSLSFFGDIANAHDVGFLSDAGAGLVAQGKFYDRNFYVRFDAPVFVNTTALAGGTVLGKSGSLAPRWTITVGDLWQP